MSLHQFAAFVVRQRVPVALFAASLAHVVETHNRPLRQSRINAFLPVMFHALAKRFHRFGEFFGFQLDVLFLFEDLRVFFLGRDVFAFLGEGQVTVNRREHIRA